MQDYEVLLGELSPLSKNVKDAANLMVRLQKAIQKNMEIGNLTEVNKSVAALQEAMRRN